MKPEAYLETSVISYLTARPSHELIVAGRQQITKDWWEIHRENFDLFVSQLVVEEASEGDEKAARERLGVIEELPILETGREVVPLRSGADKQGVAI
jgi:hypothetical protein